MKIKLSIVYVYYNTPEELELSIKSLEKACAKIPYEVIIVNNNSPKSIPNQVHRRPNLTIINNHLNYGYGKGLNLGASIAKGEYLVLANPDIIFEKEAIKNMFSKIEKNPKIGVIAPQLIERSGDILQSISGMPYLLQSLFVFSFLSKIWRKNPFSAKYHNLNLDRNREHEVDVVSGACMMVKKSVFDKVGGFDERFFMYFEEADFCFRIKKFGYEILYLPKAKAIHLVGRSNQDKEWIGKAFEQSRFKFFKKYHGLIPALLGEFFLRFFKPLNILLLSILALSVFLNLYKLNEQMIFIGDQGWFYLSARDLLLTGKIPLVGITSSHTWLHQGPLWTYILAVIFWLFKFNPIAPAYFTALLSTVTILLVYKVGKILFSQNVGLIGAVLYVTSPLVIITARMPYHTSAIPFLSLLFILFLYKWLKGNKYFFSLTLLTLSLLYNFELATQVLWFVLLIILIYGIFKKKKWLSMLLDLKIIILSALSIVIPLYPILMYDYSHGFLQTLGFALWIGYKIFQFFSADITETNSIVNFVQMFKFYEITYGKLLFPISTLVQLFLFISSLGVYLLSLYGQIKHNKINLSYILLGLWVFIPLIAFTINKTPSGAYSPLLFPAIFLLTALFFDKFMQVPFLKLIIIGVIISITLANSYYLLPRNYLMAQPNGPGIEFSERLNAAKNIVREAAGDKYNIVGKGPGSEFSSFTMNYEYLAWWLGNGPEKNPSKLRFIISETNERTILEKRKNND